MNNKKSPILSSHPAVIAVWAALIAVATLLPAIPVIGTGATFSVGDALVPLAGILFGPVPGAICAGIGAFIGQLIAPHTVIFGPLSFFIPMLGALCAGFAMQKKWYVPLGVILLFGLAWYLFPMGRTVWYAPLAYYSIGIIASLLLAVWPTWIASEQRGRMFVGVFLTALAGAIVTHSFGNVWAMIMFQLPKEVWIAVLGIAPLQRISFALGSAIVGTPLLVGLPKIGVVVGQMMYEEEEEEEDIV
jgi:uncharacterized membrane protein